MPGFFAFARPRSPAFSLVGLTCLTTMMSLVPGVGNAAPEADASTTDASSEQRPGGLPEGLELPERLNDVEVTYPPALLELPEPPSGTIIIDATIGTDGVPRDLVVVQGVHPQLDAAIMAAVEHLRFEPARMRGEPIEVVLPIPVEVEAPTPEPVPEPKVAPTAAAPQSPTRNPAADSPPTGPVRLGGRVLEAGQRTPIRNATVVVAPAAPDAETGRIKKTRYGPEFPPRWEQQVRTDAEGNFGLRAIPDGKIRVIVVAPGYERLEYVEALEQGQQLEVRYFVQRSVDNPYRTVVRQDRVEREEVTRRTIATEEINNLPGTQGDALKAIQNFPGVARAPFGAGLLAIRGADPTDSAVFLAEHEIPQLFHFGGLTSVFNSDILTEIDFLPGNFSARYGDAIGGVIDVKPRQGRRDGYHGYIDSDLFDSGVLFEGPVGKGSFILSGRRSYIDLLLPVFLPEDAGLQLSVAPRYYDYQALFDYPVSGGNLSARVFGSGDRLRVITSNPGEVDIDARNRFESTFAFHRVDLSYVDRIGPWTLLVTPSYRYDSVSLAISSAFRLRVNSHTISSRAELSRKLSRALGWSVGAQLQSNWYDLLVQALPFPGATATGSSQAERRTTERDDVITAAVYSAFHVNIRDQLHVFPEVRVTAYSAPFRKHAFDPRLRAVWNVADNTSIKGGAGLYSQVPEPVEWNRVYGNPDVLIERAVHTSLGVEQTFDPGISLEVTGFYKYLWDLATPSFAVTRQRDGSTRIENVASVGTGRIFGAEVFLRKELTRRLFAWLSYTVSRSERRAAPNEDWILFGLDQTHLLTLLAVYKLPENWQIGARFRLASGNPYTPHPGAVFDASGGYYFPLEGETNSGRLPTFHQLDIRVDKRFIWRRVMLNLYLDVQNVYNQQNAEFVNYAFDYRSRNAVPSLPIIPSIGMRLEF